MIQIALWWSRRGSALHLRSQVKRFKICFILLFLQESRNPQNIGFLLEIGVNFCLNSCSKCYCGLSAITHMKNERKKE